MCWAIAAILSATRSHRSQARQRGLLLSWKYTAAPGSSGSDCPLLGKPSSRRATLLLTSSCVALSRSSSPERRWMASQTVSGRVFRMVLGTSVPIASWRIAVPFEKAARRRCRGTVRFHPAGHASGNLWLDWSITTTTPFPVRTKHHGLPPPAAVDEEVLCRSPFSALRATVEPVARDAVADHHLALLRREPDALDPFHQRSRRRAAERADYFLVLHDRETAHHPPYTLC